MGVDTPITKECSKEVILINSFERIRRERGITQVELAQKIGATQGAISMIENGERNPSVPMIVRIAEALDCTVDELLASETTDEKVVTMNDTR